ncbi:host-nuclease inhibitor Gam family protein [Clostridium botulinum]|uniref:Uncharacterized protein n=1 Tax=Clostridium botulinum TaxID=1491 RepID=A0A9Q1UXS4_CLOBO|nr:host-nuclease inhibitor Gam family protein [Clostridium botulinum]KEI04702.1 hypothetical protein Y848_00640 [Clostridium botulinum C/D str. Sp77]KLU76928.1 hypothetical protein CBC3_01085 [Clostridium botulinum V891]KOA75225.1 hypothetical protein ADU78_08540 [Clostridium botulinum]KOA79005.1 hypothetical protein ADU77_04960 [Clostridium botulinum]KOA83221.1 hypothetical protein ADU80_12615 [Clostridium botulinum]
MMNALLKNEIKEMNEVIEEQVTTFKVDSLESANWCFRKIRALKEQIENNKALANAEKFRIDSWEKKENESALNSIDYFESLVTEYFKEEKIKDKKFKLSTPYGKVSSRKSKTWKYENEELTLEYLKKNDYFDLIKVKEDLNKTELKKVFKDGVNKETGEILPGVSVEEKESISIKVE